MGSVAGQSRLRVYGDGEDGWVVYCRLGDPPGTSPVRTLQDRYTSAEAAMSAAEGYLAAHLAERLASRPDAAGGR
jgi:hypothetical protein